MSPAQGRAQDAARAATSRAREARLPHHGRRHGVAEVRHRSVPFDLDQPREGERRQRYHDVANGHVEVSRQGEVAGHDIAVFLSAANPRHWPLADTDAMMTDHLDLTFDEAVARLQGNYAADIAAYEEIHRQILHMADMLSDGIIAQFPRAFSGAKSR